MNIKGQINEPVELRTLSVGDWYATLSRRRAYRIVKIGGDFYSTDPGTGDYEDVLVHPLTKIGDEFWYKGSEPKADDDRIAKLEARIAALEAATAKPERTDITLPDVPVGRWFRWQGSNYRRLREDRERNNALREDGSPAWFAWDDQPCTLLPADWEPAKPTHMERLPESLREQLQSGSIGKPAVFTGDTEALAREICEAFPDATGGAQ